MADTLMRVGNIRPGITIIEDIFANTKFPIIRKNTELTTEHIVVLNVFGIKEVKVKDRIVVKEKVLMEKSLSSINPDEILSKIRIDEKEIKAQYDEAVSSYRREFNGWRAGIRPDIPTIRGFMIPLLEVFHKQNKMLNLLNDFSNQKDYLYHHSIAVGILASSISKEMGYPVGQTLQIGLAGALADCGMSKIDPRIIEKAAFLSNEEFNEVKQHTIRSYQMLKDTPFLREEMKTAIFQHHERLDGSGYPRGNKEGGISIIAQIIAVADVFHAMTSGRVYRAKQSVFKVIELITEEEFGKYNINVVQALHKLVGNLSIGMNVQLTDGKEGEVIFIHRDTKLRPSIKMNEDQTILNLTTNRHLAIEKVLQ